MTVVDRPAGTSALGDLLRGLSLHWGGVVTIGTKSLLGEGYMKPAGCSVQSGKEWKLAQNLLNLLRLVYILQPRSKHWGRLSRQVRCLLTFASSSSPPSSQLARALNGGRLVVLDLTTLAAGCLNSLDNSEGLIIGNFTEHDMLPIKP